MNEEHKKSLTRVSMSGHIYRSKSIGNGKHMKLEINAKKLDTRSRKLFGTTIAHDSDVYKMIKSMEDWINGLTSSWFSSDF